jgi:hypothetical protein
VEPRPLPSAVTGEHWGRKDGAPVKHVLLTSLMVLPLLSACTTDPYTGRPDAASRIMGGALIGGALGAVGGGALGGHAITGAAAGMVAGGALGAATTAQIPPPRRYYRDTRGYCYYIDASGQPRYDYTVTC